MLIVLQNPSTCVNFYFWILQSSAILLFAAKTTEMRKLLITLILMSVLPATLRSDDDIAREIDLKSVDVRIRSIVSSPEAAIFKDILFVSFDASGIYSLYIEDNMGNIVYTSTLPADGMEYSYDLSGIGEGAFILTLEGTSGDYKGYFIYK